jgi:hypothetical protein
MRMIFWLRGACLAGTLALLLSACDSAAVPQPTATSTQTPIASITPLTFSSCPTVREYPQYEAQGTIRSGTGADTSGEQLWVWFQSLTSEHYGQPYYSQGKFVWRMTGHGDFHVLALGPHGEQFLPKEGSEAHLGSTWTTHLGDEWGTIMTFSSAGCWDLHAWRDDVSGDVALRIE